MRAPLLLAAAAAALASAACATPRDAAQQPPAATAPIAAEKLPLPPPGRGTNDPVPLPALLPPLPEDPPPLPELPEDPPPPRDERAEPDPSPPNQDPARRPLLLATPPPLDLEHPAPRPGEEVPLPNPLVPRATQLAQPRPSVPSPVGPERLLYCERRSPLCWSCATLDLTAQRPCEQLVCPSGICAVTGTTARCLPAERRCCDREPCAKAPSRTACAPTCGDPDGDGVHDRCLLPDTCPEQSLLATDVIRSYALQRPASWYRAVCGPIPEAARAALEPRPPAGTAALARDAPLEPVPARADPGRCDPAAVLWTIPVEVMGTGASDRGGPGLCYGVATPGVHRSCGSPHCDTLRYCDGREKPAYCTVVSACVDGVPRAMGFTW